MPPNGVAPVGAVRLERGFGLCWSHPCIATFEHQRSGIAACASQEVICPSLSLKFIHLIVDGMSSSKRFTHLPLSFLSEDRVSEKSMSPAGEAVETV